MTILTLSKTGALQLEADALAHLGVSPGDAVELSLVEGKGLVVKPATSRDDPSPQNGRPGDRPLDRAFGMLRHHYDGPARSIEEINAAIDAAWAGER